MTTPWRNYSGNLQKSSTSLVEQLKKKIEKLYGSQYPVAQCSLFNFFLKSLDQRCWRFSKVYLNNFYTELSSQIFDCHPRNFLIQKGKYWQCSQYLTLNPTCATPLHQVNNCNKIYTKIISTTGSLCLHLFNHPIHPMTHSPMSSFIR